MSSRSRGRPAMSLCTRTTSTGQHAVDGTVEGGLLVLRLGHQDVHLHLAPADERHIRIAAGLSHDAHLVAVGLDRGDEVAQTADEEVDVSGEPGRQAVPLGGESSDQDGFEAQGLQPVTELDVGVLDLGHGGGALVRWPRGRCRGRPAMRPPRRCGRRVRRPCPRRRSRRRPALPPDGRGHDGQPRSPAPPGRPWGPVWQAIALSPVRPRVTRRG